MDVRQVSPGVTPNPDNAMACHGMHIDGTSTPGDTWSTTPNSGPTASAAEGASPTPTQAGAAAELLENTTAEQQQDMAKFFSLPPADRARAIEYFNAVSANNERWFNSLTPSQQADAKRFFALSPADRDQAIAYFRAIAENQRRAAAERVERAAVPPEAMMHAGSKGGPRQLHARPPESNPDASSGRGSHDHTDPLPAGGDDGGSAPAAPDPTPAEPSPADVARYRLAADGAFRERFAESFGGGSFGANADPSSGRPAGSSDYIRHYEPGGGSVPVNDSGLTR